MSGMPDLRFPATTLEGYIYLIFGVALHNLSLAGIGVSFFLSRFRLREKDEDRLVTALSPSRKRVIAIAFVFPAAVFLFLAVTGVLFDKYPIHAGLLWAGSVGVGYFLYRLVVYFADKAAAKNNHQSYDTLFITLFLMSGFCFFFIWNAMVFSCGGSFRFQDLLEVL